MSYNIGSGYSSESGKICKGVAVHSEEGAPAKFDHLKFITTELQQNTENTEPNCII